MSLVHVGFRIADADGDTSSMSVKVPLAALTLAELVEFAEELAVLIDDSIDGVIQEITIQTSVDLPGGLQASAVAGSEVQKGGLLSFTAADTPYRWSVRVPAMTPAKFTGNVVDDTDDDIIALIAAFEDGLDATGTTVEPCDKYENDLTAYIEGVKSFRH
jgi:hypothetical protein